MHDDINALCQLFDLIRCRGGTRRCEHVVAGVTADHHAARRHALRGAAAAVEDIAFDVSDGRDPYQTWRGAWMVGHHFARLAQLDQFGPNLKGNVKAGLKVTALDVATAEETRQRLFHRFRELFERYDVLLTPAAPVKPYPIEMNFPNEINGTKFENYVDWIAPAFLITLMSLPAGSVPAGKTGDGLPVGLQVVAPRFEEPRILSVAKLIQQFHPIGWPPYS
jgi:amidase